MRALIGAASGRSAFQLKPTMAMIAMDMIVAMPFPERTRAANEPISNALGAAMGARFLFGTRISGNGGGLVGFAEKTVISGAAGGASRISLNAVGRVTLDMATAHSMAMLAAS